MKKPTKDLKFNVFFRGPYGPWELTTEQPQSAEVCKSIVDTDAGVRSERIYVVCAEGDSPGQMGGSDGKARASK